MGKKKGVAVKNIRFDETSAKARVILLPLLALGLKGMIGKGRRSAEVVQAIREHGAVYFITIGGAAALLAEAVKKKTPVCYEDLGPEAICRLEVENFYAIVGIDSRGNTIIR